MTKLRTKIPPNLLNAVLYKCAKTCSVCRTPLAPVEVHHIDQNPANNVEDNLVALCRNCHDDAHTKRSLSQKLTPTRLIDFKQKWQDEVASRAALAMLPSSNLSQAMWTYVNHQRLPDVMKSKGVRFDPSLLRTLRAANVVDEAGIPTFHHKGRSTGLNTIYDRFEWDDSQRLHNLYTRAVDELIVESHPIELGAIWTKMDIKSILRPGDICFCMRGFRFKRGAEVDGEEDRVAYAKARGIEVKFTANTRHMYGSSALYDAFSGNRFAAALLLVRDISQEDSNLVIRATPLAMGAGFVPNTYKTPYPIRYGWARGTYH